MTSYGDAGFSLFLRKAFIKAMGYSDDALNRPIVGITNTYSDYNPCHGNVPQLIEAVKRGVMLAGAMPMVFPTISIHESFAHPTSMYLRNLMAMDTEEMIRAQPMDAVVVIGGCDKTLPAQIMAAVSADLPTVVIPVGPMVVGHHKGEVLGACTDCRRLWGEHRAGEIDERRDRGRQRPAGAVGRHLHGDGHGHHHGLHHRSAGPVAADGATIPAPHAERSARRSERQGGRRDGGGGGPRPSEIRDPGAFRNAQVVHAGHRRLDQRPHPSRRDGQPHRHRIDLEDFDKLGREVPVLVDLKPSGEHYMEHFHHAGGVPKLMRELGDLSISTCPTVAGRNLARRRRRRRGRAGQNVIRPRPTPSRRQGPWRCCAAISRRVERVIKHSAATPRLLQHTGRAVVFESVEDMAQRIDDPDLDVGRRRRAGAPQHRPEGRARNAGSRLSADSEKARARRA